MAGKNNIFTLAVAALLLKAFCLVGDAQQSAVPFSDVKTLCDALSNIGLQTRSWKPIPDLGYQCITDYVDFGPKDARGYGLASNIAYYVSGKTATKVDDVTIMINVNVPQTRAEAKKRMLEAAQHWFKAVRRSVPAGLEAAIRADKSFKTKADQLNIEYSASMNGKVFEMKLRTSS